MVPLKFFHICRCFPSTSACRRDSLTYTGSNFENYLRGHTRVKRREFLKSAAAASVTAGWAQPQSAAATPQNNPEQQQPDYPLGPDSKLQPDVPSGKIFSFSMDESRFFPGTHRTVDVYIPAQYTADRPACVLVALDHLMRTLPIVFDNLIHRKELPVIIAIGLSSGSVPSADPPQNPRFNRSFEFDSLSEVLADFILQELLPAVEQHKTPDGLPIHLSTDPNDRGMMGGSTGGIGSFTVAWQRPDAFRRVYSMIGTYVGMRGGDRYPVLVRKTDPKPLRVFLQDGSRDGWPGGLEFGDWWMSNQEMERALTFSGYEVNHTWGVLGHEGSHGESILPDVMRWLWKDWPKPVEAGSSQNSMLRTVLVAQESWEQVWPSPAAPASQSSNAPIYRISSVLNSQSTAAALASDSSGRVYVQNPSTGRIDRVNVNGSAEHFATVSPGNNGIAFGPDGRLYVAETAKERIVALNGQSHAAVIAEGIRGVGLTVTHAGNIYVTEPNDAAPYSGKVWLIHPHGGKAVVAEGLNVPTGISLSPDGLWLCAAESKGHHGYSYRVQPTGELQLGEPYYWFHVPDTANDSGVSQVCMDRDGYAYAATRMGVQVFDRNGRVRAILPVDGHQLAGICFGDADMQTLYVSTGDAIYRRKLKSVGFPASAAPIVLPQASAG
jgi:gluconolactonase